MAKSIQDKLDEFEKQDASSRIESKLDSFESDEDEVYSKMNDVDDLNRPQNKEGGTVGSLYKGLKNTTVLGKPIAMAATPVLEVARMPFKYIAENVGENTSQTPPIDAYAEFNDIYPSDRATTTNLLTDIANSVGIKTSNLGKVTSKDYPQAAQFVENLTNPYNVAGMGTDIALGSQLPKGVNKIAGKMSGVEELAPGLTRETPDLIPTKKLDRVAMAKAYLKSKAKNKQLLQTMEESGKVNDAASLMASNPKEYIRPFSASKTLDYIEGPVVTEKGADTSITSSKRDIGQGRLGKLLEDQNTAIEQIPRTHDVPKVELVAAAKGELARKGLLPTQVNAASKMIDDIINITHADSDKISLIQRTEQAGKDLQQVSKDLADEVTKQVLDLSAQKGEAASKIRNVPEQIENPDWKPGFTASQQRMIPNEQYKVIENDINTKVADIDQRIADITSGKADGGKNMKNYSALKKQKAALEKFYYDNLDDSALDMNMYMDFIDKQNLKPIGYSSDIRRQGNKLMSAIGNETPQEMGSAHAAGSALEYAGANAQQTAMDMAPKIDNDMYKARNKEISANMSVRDLMNNQRTAPQNKFNVPVMDMARGAARQAIDLYPEYIRPYAQKGAQGAINMGTKAANTARIPLPMQLIEYQIPRNSEEILANKDAVIAKIAQMTNDPNAVSMLQDALLKHPEKLPKVLPALVLQYPDLFEDDDYNRVDGKIFDPQLKAKALKDIQNSQALSLREKAFKAKRLEMEGILDW